MAYLIAATDFTDISLNAVNYACGMAMDLGMKDDPDADILDTICRQLLGPLLEG